MRRLVAAVRCIALLYALTLCVVRLPAGRRGAEGFVATDSFGITPATSDLDTRPAGRVLTTAGDHLGQSVVRQMPTSIGAAHAASPAQRTATLGASANAAGASDDIASNGIADHGMADDSIADDDLPPDAYTSRARVSEWPAIPLVRLAAVKTAHVARRPLRMVDPPAPRPPIARVNREHAPANVRPA
jgi:hypothetical protein